MLDGEVQERIDIASNKRALLNQMALDIKEINENIQGTV